MYRQRNRHKRNFSIDKGSYVAVAKTSDDVAVLAVGIKKDDVQAVIFEEHAKNPKRDYFLKRWEL